MSKLPTFKKSQFPSDPRFYVGGRTGSGKTAGVDYILQHYRNNYKIVVLDVKNEHASHYKPLEITDFGKKGFIARVNQIKVANPSRYITDHRELLEFLADLMFQFTNSILVVEEAPMLIPNSGVSLYKSHPNTAKLLMQGRAERKGIIFVAQSASDIHKSCIKQTTAKFVFDMEQYEKDNSKKYFGSDIDWNTMGENQFSFSFISAGTEPKVYHKFGVRPEMIEKGI